VVPETLYWTVGSKLEYNDFTGLELQPSTRLAWHPTASQTVWGAVSRAVRTPSSIENDISVLGAVTPGPTELRIVGNTEQKSEELIAYELGHRITVTKDLSFDTALYFNDFDKLQTLSVAGASFTGANGNTVTARSSRPTGMSARTGGWRAVTPP
jgi:iron complex outermembrane receptor protein